ncbi:MAG: hypothetical protein ACTSRP_17795 [Candidatus Helarchaeota archaeon]
MSFKEEYNNACRKFHNDPYVLLETYHNNIEHLKVIIIGLEGTPYEGGRFIFEIEFKNVPLEPRNITYHLILRFSRNDLQSDMTVRDFKKEVYGDLSPLFMPQLFLNGKFLPDNLKLREINFNPKKDTLTQIFTLAKRGPRMVPLPHWAQILKWDKGIGFCPKGYAYCQTMIWHPNFDPSIPPGRPNFHFGPNWNPLVDLSELIMGIKKLIHMDPNLFAPKNPFNLEAGEQYINDRNAFNEKARRWTIKYAQ